MVFLVLLGVFVATVSLCVGAYVFVHRRQFAAAELARSRLGEPPDAARLSAPSILRDTSASELELLDRLLSGKAITARLARELQHAGSAANPGTFVLALGIGGVSGALLGSVLGSGLSVPFALVGLAVPILWIKHRQRRRLAAFQEQLPEALDMLVSAMRAGYSFQTAMKLVGEEMPSPLGTEFLQFYDEQRLGAEGRAALLALQDRSASPDMKMLVTAVLIHRDTSSNLSEVLSNIAEVMRRRADERRQIDTLTIHSNFSARILAVLPLLVFGAVVSVDPELSRPMLADPVGRFMLGYAALSAIAGYLILIRIAKVDV